MCSRKIGTFLQACLGTALVGALSVGVMAQSKLPATTVQPSVAPISGSALNHSDAEMRFATTSPGPAVINRGSPPLGGGCQTAANNNGLNYTAFSVADNFNPTTDGQLTAVSWSAAYRGNTAAPFIDGTPPAIESFQIRVLNDNAGVPGTAVFTATVSNATRANSGASLPGNANSAALTIWDYTANLTSGPNLTAGTCYWLEITNTSTLAAPTNVSFWITANILPGDSVDYQIPRVGCGYSVFDQGANDLTFCTNLALNNLDLVNCPLATPPAPSCANPSTNGNGTGSTSNTGIYCVTTGVSNYGGTARFQAAENFQLQTGGDLTSVCFWGFFIQQTPGGRAASCTSPFDIIIWNRDPGTGGPSATPLATRTVDGTSVTVTRGIDATGNDAYTVDFSGSPITLAANTCYYITVSMALVTADVNRQACWLWGTVPDNTGSPILDGSVYIRTVSTAGVGGAWTRYINQIGANANNMSYLLNVGPVTATNCNVQPPANDTCATAATLPLTGAVLAGSNVNGQGDDLPGTAFDLVDGSAVWYTFVGTGNDVTVTTCDAATALDTVLHVYCAPNSCAGPFNRVAGNDDDATPCAAVAGASMVTFPTIAATRYYVVVNGFNGTENVFRISATQGAPSAAATCADNCDLNAEPFDVAETDPCGAGTGLDNNNTCATATNYPTIGQTGKGSVSTAEATGFRDVDIWRLPASANGATVTLHISSENPVLVQFLNNPTGDCANITGSNPPTPFTVVPNTSFGVAACVDLDTEIFDVTLPATGANFFLVTTPGFGGSECGQGRDEYRFQVAIPAMGACCLNATACFVTTFTDCAAQSAGAPTDFWAQDVACDVNPCDSQPGKCCLPDGTCQLTPSATIGNEAACTATGGVYTVAGVCEPNTCPIASNGACCRGTTCALDTSANCTGANTRFAGANTVCNVAGNNTTPCCKADFNQSGAISVQDIFDFLGAYFTANPYADINASSSVTVQDIFDFLGAYFSGGCS